MLHEYGIRIKEVWKVHLYILHQSACLCKVLWDVQDFRWICRFLLRRVQMRTDRNVWKSGACGKTYSWATTVHGRALKHVQDILKKGKVKNMKAIMVKDDYLDITLGFPYEVDRIYADGHIRLKNSPRIYQASSFHIYHNGKKISCKIKTDPQETIEVKQ